MIELVPLCQLPKCSFPKTSTPPKGDFQEYQCPKM